MGERVGIVGIGLMGSALSANLLQAGYEVQGYDIDNKRIDEFAERGGIPMNSSAEVAAGVQWMITSLPNSEIVREVALGPNGIVEGVKSNLILCDATTSRPEDSEDLGKILSTRGIRFLDSCVSGTSSMAWKKDLIIIAGGEEEDFEACRTYFSAISRAAYLMGPVGAGALTKLIINLILAGNRIALAEGLVLGSKAGMELNNLLSVLQDAACSSKTMFDKGPKMINGDYSAEGRMSGKTPFLMLEQGRRYGAPLLVTSVWMNLVQAGCQMGLEGQDPIAFYEVLRQMAGLPVGLDK